MNKRWLIAVLVGLAAIGMFINGCETANKLASRLWVPKDGFVPDSATAVSIAEAIWLPIFGEEIYYDTPFVAVLEEETVWHVQGTLPRGDSTVLVLGGVYHALIRKRDGKIISVYSGA